MIAPNIKEEPKIDITVENKGGNSLKTPINIIKNIIFYYLT